MNGFVRMLGKKNLAAKPARTTAMILLSALLSLSVFGGSLVVRSLQRGLESYEARLGADIVVVPAQARSHGTFESILLQGIPGYFYMDEGYLEKVAAREGVEAVSPQFFLASASAGCCSVSVQIIGFDPATDFAIQPWIAQSYGGTMGIGDIIVGSGIAVPKNRKLRFYNMECDVVAQLSETGTGLDNAVYATMDTIRQMMEYSKKEGFRYYDGNPYRAISSVMVKVADGYDIEAVTDDINIHVRRVEASQAKTMISDIAGGLRGASRIVGILVAMIWVLALAVLMVACFMSAGGRRKEFAVLRVLGASKRMLTRLLLVESLATSLIGTAAGIGLSALLLFSFGGLLRDLLGLPYLLPGASALAGILIGSFVLSAVAGVSASMLVTGHLVKDDAGLTIREEM